jgi:hypothetical protein
MSEKRFASIAHELQEAVTNAAWIQWQALGGQAAPPRAPGAIVDPDALVLVSLWLEDDERRLRDFLHGFAELGSRMLSVQRLKRAMGAFPPDAPPSTRFGEAGSLMLRLRTAFGVDVRTDTLAYLIGRRGAWAGVKEIADALFYAKYSVRGACEALADARLIKSHTDRPVKYYAEPERWTALLDLRDTAPWHPWVAIYAFVLRLLAWLRGPGAEVESSYVASSLAREFMREHGGILTQIQLDAPEGRDYLGESYLEAFEQTVFALVQRLTDVA